jgi:hypothetical protein
MSASVQSNVPAELRQEAQAHYIKERDSIIPRFYNASMHDAHLDAKVVYDGMPIVQGGETLTIGLVPPERRWAIGEVQDGWAACINQQKFDELCKLWKQQEIQFKSQGTEVLDFPDLEPRPNVRDFVAWKVHKTDPSRLIRLGMPHERQVVRQGTHVYDPETDTQMTRDEWAAREKARLGGKATDAQATNARIAELEAKLAALTATPEAPILTVTSLKKAAVETEAAPCGKQVQKNRVGAHKRFCKKPECQPMIDGDAA